MKLIINEDAARYIRSLDDEQAGELLRAACRYAIDGQNTDFLEGTVLDFLWNEVRRDMDGQTKNREACRSATESATQATEEENQYKELADDLMTAADTSAIARVLRIAAASEELPCAAPVNKL